MPSIKGIIYKKYAVYSRHVFVIPAWKWLIEGWGLSKPKEVCQMQVIDAVDTAAARLLVKADNIFGIIVTYGLQIAELTLTGRFVRHDIRTAVWRLFIKYNK